MNLYEIALLLNSLSDKADEIKKLDRDRFKHHTDLQILEVILDEKIEKLKSYQ